MRVEKKKTVLLCILDGIGNSPIIDGNAVKSAKTPVFDNLYQNYPHSELRTDGKFIGLTPGQMGNSEVGHLTIGTGRVIKQLLVRIADDLSDKSFSNFASYKAFTRNASGGRAIHLVGLLSDGGIHSHSDQLIEICRLLNDLNKPIFIHAFSDGRDTGINDGIVQFEQFQKKISSLRNVHLATIVGRFYGMDRDNRWERTEKGWNLLVNLQGKKFSKASDAFKEAYATGLSDEHILPSVLELPQGLDPRIQDDDSVFLFNFRGDRMRQLTRCFLGTESSGFCHIHPKLKSIASMTQYDKEFEGRCLVIYEPETQTNILSEIVSKAGLRQLHIAETEKYPHVTFFFNNGQEAPFPNEDRILVPSPKDVKTYDLKPEMSLPIVTEKVKAAIESGKYDFIVLNIANGDMVGHTGNFNAAVQAVEWVDKSLGEILAVLKEQNGEALIIADHGNIEQMAINGMPSTTHTTYPVPCIYFGPRKAAIVNGTLADVAPSILHLLGLKVPREMTGKSLIDFGLTNSRK